LLAGAVLAPASVFGVTVAGDPDRAVVRPGTGLDGVVAVEAARADTGQRWLMGSGSLLFTGRHILTAAHPFTGGEDQFLPLTGGTPFPDGLATSVRFELPTGSVEIAARRLFIHPEWNGRFAEGNDIAILELVDAAPDGADAYDVYRADDEVGRTGTLAGYGASGTGEQGSVLPHGTLRAGKNRFDTPGEAFRMFQGREDTLPGALLSLDFDSGRRDNDAAGLFAGASDTGVGIDEAFAAPGDSGGPTFLDGKVAGVHSHITQFKGVDGKTPDVDGEFFTSTFGEVMFDTRASYYADWVDRTVASSLAIPLPPAVWAGLGTLGLAALGARRLRPKRA
jgi:hypothetical protein